MIGIYLCLGGLVGLFLRRFFKHSDPGIVFRLVMLVLFVVVGIVPTIGVIMTPWLIERSSASSDADWWAARIGAWPAFAIGVVVVYTRRGRVKLGRQRWIAPAGTHPAAPPPAPTPATGAPIRPAEAPLPTPFLPSGHRPDLPGGVDRPPPPPPPPPPPAG